MRSFLFGIVVLLAACQAGAPLGATCERNAACSSPLVCRFGRCRNECAAQRDCPVGTTCLLDASGNGSCALIDDPDCSVTGGSCPAPLACVGRVCLNVCTLGVECPPGSACQPTGDGRARCVRADESDAGAIDGGDAGSSACAPPTCDPATQLGTGDTFSCARTSGGRLWCWGGFSSTGRDGNNTGCLPTGGEDACPVPALLQSEDDAGHVLAAAQVESIDADVECGCYVSAGHVYCWGMTASAPLGRTGADGARARAVQLATGGLLTDVAHVHVLHETAIAVTTSGQWFGWGDNPAGELALAGSQALATALPALTFAADDVVATARHHACAIHAGQVICWGSNVMGESDPSSPLRPGPLPPTVVAGVAGATDLMLGHTHSCALVGTNLVCWGERATFFVDGDMGACHATDIICGPTTILTPSPGFSSLVPMRNADDLCAIDTSHRLWCWGAGYSGVSSRPALVPALPPVRAAVASWSHACAIAMSDGAVWCWGQDGGGQVGHGTPTNTVHAPALVAWP